MTQLTIDSNLPLVSRLAQSFEDRISDVHSLADSITSRNEAPDRHTLRVSIRNLREITRLAKTLRLPIPDETQAQLKWVSDALGTLRDADVQLELIEKEVGRSLEPGSPASQQLLNRYRRLRGLRLGTVRRRLKLDQFKNTMSEIEAVSANWTPDTAREDVGKFTLNLIEKRQRAVKQLAGKVGKNSTPEQVHDLRISIKKLRYLVENVADPDKKPVRAYLKNLRRCQTRLGEHQDYTMFRESLLDFGTEGDEAKLAASIAEKMDRKAAKTLKGVKKSVEPITGKEWKAARKSIKKSLAA